MFGLSVQLAAGAAMVDDDLFQPVIHVDRGVQVHEGELEMRSTTPLTCAPCAAEDAELAQVTASRASHDEQRLSSSRPSPYPRRSDGASPWLLDESDGSEGDTDAVGAEGGSDEDGGAEDGSNGNWDGEPGEPPPEERRLELAQATFLAGHTSGEVLAGMIGFYRYANPAGVFGLRPPPLRSNIVCLMAVPAWMSPSDLIRFVGGYTRYVRHMRLVRDASMPHRHMLLLQFASPAIAERFRADYHAKRFNSLEPEVALAVHIAHVLFSPPPPPSHGGSGLPTTTARSTVNVRLHITPRSLALSAPPSPSGAPTVPMAAAAASAPAGTARDVATSSAAASPLQSPADAAGPSPFGVGGVDAAVRVRVQLWLGTPKHAPSPPPVPQPPLPAPSAEAVRAVERAVHGHRAVLPALPEGTLLGSAVELPGCPVCLERLDPSIRCVHAPLAVAPRCRPSLIRTSRGAPSPTPRPPPLAPAHMRPCALVPPQYHRNAHPCWTMPCPAFPPAAAS